MQQTAKLHHNHYGFDIFNENRLYLPEGGLISKVNIYYFSKLTRKKKVYFSKTLHQ